MRGGVAHCGFHASPMVRLAPPIFIFIGGPQAHGHSGLGVRVRTEFWICDLDITIEDPVRKDDSAQPRTQPQAESWVR